VSLITKKKISVHTAILNFLTKLLLQCNIQTVVTMDIDWIIKVDLTTTIDTIAATTLLRNLKWQCEH
jgi:hypothetical protein